jgi:NADPH:quinone reductase-like Zn-dependent oxidoreductase
VKAVFASGPRRNSDQTPSIAASIVHGSRHIRIFSASPETSVLRGVAAFVASGALRPVIDSVYSLADIAAAHQASWSSAVTIRVAMRDSRFRSASDRGATQLLIRSAN